MFKKFIINIEDIKQLSKPTDEIELKTDKEAIHDAMVSYIKNATILNGCIKAEELNDVFYRTDDFHVFISHKGEDRPYAKKLADWLWSNFGIRSFIDYYFWGDLAELQPSIDEFLCRHNAERNTWNYHDRNYSTAHTHMMLSNALSEMIRKTECFIFIESSNSVSANPKGVKKDTSSPWIFHELYTVNTIQIEIPDRMKKNEKSLEFFNESVEKAIGYNVTDEIQGLEKLSIQTLTKVASKRISEPENALTEIYSISHDEKSL